MMNEILSVPFGAEGFEFCNNDLESKICFVCKDNQELDILAKNIAFFMPQVQVIKFPERDALPYEKMLTSRQIIQERIRGINGLLNAEKFILLCTIRSLGDFIPDREFIKRSILTLNVNAEYQFDKLAEDLVMFGYSRMVNAEFIGEFAIRGSVIDVVLSDDGLGVRLDFFGNRLDSIRFYQTDSQRSVNKVEKIEILPINEILLDDKRRENFLKNYRKRFGLERNTLIESVHSGVMYSGIENWLKLFYDEGATLSSWLKNTAIYLPENYQVLENELLKFLEERYQMRSGRFRDEVSFLEPSELYAKIDTNNFAKSYKYTRLNLSSSKYEIPESVYIKAKEEQTYSLEYLKKFLSRHGEKKVVICFPSDGAKNRMAKILEENEVRYSEPRTLQDVASGLSLVLLDMEHGFANGDFIFFTEYEINGRVSKKKVAKKTAAYKGGDIFNDVTALSIGDLVVHIEHGIGKFNGLVQLDVSGKKHDFVELHYADGAIFYLPVENLDLLTRYGEGSDDKLDRLGGVSWQGRKAKLKKRIKIFSEKLLKIAAARQMQTKEVVDYDKDFYNEIAERFPYPETEDQERSINDVIADLESDKPMDRLICGDVGFGKTEVALRAACAVVAAKEFKQVAVLVPTTLLARQHYKTFKERFANTPVRIAQVSKFVSRTDINRAKKNLKEGYIDIIIGTHALLAKDVSFKNLGLLIIDEEQHFGVVQKERLKEFKKNCDILTLSATPIPRTLQMSLLGIRDLSIIATPPVNRLPVKTVVMANDILTLREAILREVARDGRVFYVTPRIAYLDGIVDVIKENIPEVKVIKAHGQMKAAELDKVMNEFYDGKYQVLVSTNIIESGLDIPFANTVIVDRADMYGMSQLYQIRGRVGRSNLQSYAYLTYHASKKLNGNAEKKLSILSSLDSLGSGFTLASHDMDIRGYGNLVGDEQSGHIKEVGVELYQNMLKDAIESLKDEQEVEGTGDWSPVINIGLSVQIPESYIPDASLRIYLYRKIACLSKEEELEDFAADMNDKYGSIPEEVEHLFEIVKLRNLAKKAGVDKIDLGEKALIVSFRQRANINMIAIVEYIKKASAKIKLREDNKLLIFIDKAKRQNITRKIIDLLIAISN